MLDSLPIERRKPSERRPQHLCLDAGYIGEPVKQLAEIHDYILHVTPRSKEHEKKVTVPGYKARRWAVERLISWVNHYRGMLIRWQKKVGNYLAMLKMVPVLICFHASSTVSFL